MPRRERLFVAGIPCHVIQRGHNRSACFNNESDYIQYLKTLEEQADKNACDVHAYVLMTNHVHLLVTPGNADSVSLLMKNLGQRYVQYFNRRYERSGSLWEGRFKSCITQTESYVLACYRYIEMNPVRATMVKHPAEYRWSSYSINVGTKYSSLVTPHPSFLALGRTSSARHANYEKLVGEYLDDDTVHRIRDATRGNAVFGSSKFEKEILQTEKLRSKIPPGSDPGSDPD